MLAAIPRVLVLLALARAAHGFSAPAGRGHVAAAPSLHRSRVVAAIKQADVDAVVARCRKRFPNSREGNMLWIEPKQAQSQLQAIAKVYGEEAAVEMALKEPRCLFYNTAYMKPAFDAFAENFGEEETKGMVMRNPNLLAVRPDGYGGASGAGNEAMYASYVVDFTRSFGGYITGLVFFLLSVPAIEILTGVPRSEFLSVLLNR